jgi:hypothetical protein
MRTTVYDICTFIVYHPSSLHSRRCNSYLVVFNINIKFHFPSVFFQSGQSASLQTRCKRAAEQHTHISSSFPMAGRSRASARMK